MTAVGVDCMQAAGFLSSMIASLFFVGCAIGVTWPEIDPGEIRTYRIFLDNKDDNELAESALANGYTACIFYNGQTFRNAQIKIRGTLSRLYPKNSYTLKFIEDGTEIKVALDAAYTDPSSLRNRLVLESYRAVGLPAPSTRGIALFIGDEYLGYYTELERYSERELSDIYGTHSLFKCEFPFFGSDIPLSGLSEKQYPGDVDFADLNRIVESVRDMADDVWLDWILTAADVDALARYLVVHDFFAVRDTGRKNYYIAVNERFRLLPWDNERSIPVEYDGSFVSSRYIGGGHNALTNRLMMEGSPVRERYIELFRQLFIDDDQFVPATRERLLEYYDEIDRAVFHDSNRQWPYSEFLTEKDKLLAFIDRRVGELAPHWVDDS